MSEVNESGFDAGFSDEEKEDLERMIGAFNANRKSLTVESADESLKRQVEIIEKRFTQLGEIVLQTNKRLDSFFEILQLLHRKSEIMNDRFNRLIRLGQEDAEP
jgi:dephospho-CoA kinase